MANIVTFQTQIASVMEVLANAAVEEICRLVESSYNELQLEISHSRKENCVLKKKVKMLEIRESFYRRAHRLRNASTDRSKTSDKASERIVRVMLGSTNHKQSEKEMSGRAEELQPETLPHHQQSAGDKATDVLFIKEEIPDNVNTEESTTAENQEEDTQYGHGGIFVPVNRDDFIDQNTTLVQHCLEQINGMEPDILKNENQEMVTSPDTLLPGGEPRLEPCHEGPAESKLHSITSFASWDSRTFDVATNNQSYADSDCNGGLSTNPFLMYRGSTHPTCSYVTQTNSNDLPVHDVEHHLTHTGETTGHDTVIAPPSNLSPVPLSFKQPDGSQMQRKDKFLCKYCGKAFSQPSTLLLHQKLHTRERLHSCTLCGKRFSNATSLKRHHSIHRGEKPFRCLYCGKNFSDPSNLKKHMNVHTGEKPYGCNQCGKKFNQSSNLKTHMKIHTREKPFTCEQCGRMFAYKYILVKHQQRDCLLHPVGQM